MVRWSDSALKVGHQASRLVFGCDGSPGGSRKVHDGYGGVDTALQAFDLAVRKEQVKMLHAPTPVGVGLDKSVQLVDAVFQGVGVQLRTFEVPL